MAESNTIAFAPGQTTATIYVPVTQESIAAEKTSNVVLSNPTDSSGSVPTITNDIGLGTIEPNPVVHVTIADAAPVDDGSPGAPGQATFMVRLDHPSTSALTFDVTLNPSQSAGDPLQYITAQAVGDIAAVNGNEVPISDPQQTFSFTIPAGTTSIPLNVQLKGDSQVEPEEQFSVMLQPTAGENVVMDNSTAVGAVLADGSLATNVHAPGLTQLFGQTLGDLLLKDLQAAAERIEVALGNTVPDFDIQVSANDLGAGIYAATSPVATMSDTINGNTYALPNTLFENLFGYNPAGADAPNIDLTLSTNSEDGVSTWFSGDSTVDVAIMLTHELLHGLGFGYGYSDTVDANKDQTIWDRFVAPHQSSYVFTGSDAKIVNGGKPVPLTGVGDDQIGHLAQTDLMDPFVGASTVNPYAMFNEPISAMDVAMLYDIGYGPTSPSWFHPSDAKHLVANLDPPLPPIS